MRIQHCFRFVPLVRRLNPNARIVMQLHAELFSQNNLPVVKQRLRPCRRQGRIQHCQRLSDRRQSTAAVTEEEAAWAPTPRPAPGESEIVPMLEAAPGMRAVTIFEKREGEEEILALSFPLWAGERKASE